MERPLFAGCHRLNGNGELTGLELIRETGLLTTPIGLTNTHSVGVVRDAIIAHEFAERGRDAGFFWSLPVVGETWDGTLNDANGFHVKPEHVVQAFRAASDGPVAEGARRRRHRHDLPRLQGRDRDRVTRRAGGRRGPFTVGVLVQANYGRRARLAVNGAPVGREIGPQEIPEPDDPGFAGERLGIDHRDRRHRRAAAAATVQPPRPARRASDRADRGRRRAHER